jgi:hypothetical protein
MHVGPTCILEITIHFWKGRSPGWNFWNVKCKMYCSLQPEVGLTFGPTKRLSHCRSPLLATLRCVQLCTTVYSCAQLAQCCQRPRLWSLSKGRTDLEGLVAVVDRRLPVLELVRAHRHVRVLRGREDSTLLYGLSYNPSYKPPQVMVREDRTIRQREYFAMFEYCALSVTPVNKQWRIRAATDQQRHLLVGYVVRRAALASAAAHSRGG